MATSGTVGQTTLTVIEVLEHAARRCGLLAAQLTPEHLKLMRDNLFLFLSQLSNRGVNLWAVDRPMLGLYLDQVEYVLPTGTIDILNTYLRTPARLEATVVSSAGGTIANAVDGDVTTVCTQSAPDGNIQFDFTDPEAVAVVGILPAATGSLTLVFEASSDAATWITAKSTTAAVYTDRAWTWLAVEPAFSYRYFRIRETAGGTLNLREAYVSAEVSDIMIARFNRDDYFSIPTKQSQGSPRQYWLNRQLAPTMNVWPSPPSTFECLYLVTHRHIQDVGAYTNTLELPQRWLNPVVWNLAWQTGLELPELKEERIILLEKYAAQSLHDAEDEERDASPIYLAPNIRAYTR